MRDHTIRMSEKQGVRETAVRPAEPGATVLRFPAGRLPVADAEDAAEAAFTDLYRRRYEPMRSYAFAELGDIDAAEDVVQGVFVGLWNRYFRDGAPPPPDQWDGLLYRGVQLRLLNHRRDRHRLAVRLGTMLSMWGGRTRRWMQPADEYEHSELTQVIDHAVGRMTGRTREVFLLRREAGLSYKEIAAATGTSVHTVNALMHRAHTVVKEQVIRAGFAEAARRRTGAGARKEKGRDA